MFLDPREKVIIRIWHSALNVKHRGATTGHVSIQTTFPDSYISLWPTTRGKNEGFGIKKPIHHEFKKDYQADLDEEKRPPETTICLYSLSTDIICQEFEDITEDFKGWVLIRSGLYAPKIISPKKSHSCASLALHLLEKGGIDSLIGISSKSTSGTIYSSFVAPDSMVGHVKIAKARELKKHPETQQPRFRFAGETVVKPAKKCSII